MTDFAPLPKLSAADHVIRRPNKQLVRLQQQIALANDSNFTLTKSKSIANKGRMKTLGEVKKRFRALVATSATGDTILADRYGDRVIDFFPGKASSIVRTKETLIPIIEQAISAAEASELDAAFGQLSKSIVPTKGKKAA